MSSKVQMHKTKMPVAVLKLGSKKVKSGKVTEVIQEQKKVTIANDSDKYKHDSDNNDNDGDNDTSAILDDLKKYINDTNDRNETNDNQDDEIDIIDDLDDNQANSPDNPENDDIELSDGVEEEDTTNVQPVVSIPLKKKIVVPEPMPKMSIPNKKENSLQDLDEAMLESLRENEEESQNTTIVIPKKVVSKTRAKTIHSSQPDPDHVDDGTIPTAASKKSRKKNTVSKSTTATKKGPGRPRKTPKKEPLVRKGISKTPTNSDDHVEFLYDQPVLLKKIFQFFKSLAAAQIQIMFRPKDIIFYAEDHHKKSKIRIRIDATKLNYYYCKSALEIGVASKDLELILNKVDKEYSSVAILSSVGSTQRSITLVLENDIQIDEIHTIDLIGQYNKMENEEDFIDENYTIKFQLPSKYFKKTIGDIKTMSSQLSITQEDMESPLVFEYLTSNKKIQSKHTVKDSNKIKLASELSSGESFRVDIKIDYIKPISAAQIADDVIIMTDENKAFMTKAYIDNEAIEIKTLTEIIDDRPDDDDEEIED